MENAEENAPDLREPWQFIRIGDEFQAQIPHFIPVSQRTGENSVDMLPDKALQVWKPLPDDADDNRFYSFIAYARVIHSYCVEQSLGLLFWHRHDIKKATEDLEKFRSNSVPWLPEEDLRLSLGIRFEGKNFEKIKDYYLHNKSMAQIIERYYNNYKVREKAEERERNALMHELIIGDFEEIEDGDAEKNSSTSENQDVDIH